jgi:hypothetical protein
MIPQESSSWFDRQERPAFADAEDVRPSDDWDELAPELPEGSLWDAFQLDDLLDEPEPEQGDFWAEPDEEEER